MPTGAMHTRIRTDLERAIRSGEFPSGATLPTERELSERYGVSRSTVQRAVTDMAQAGLVVRRRRAGTTVAPGGVAQNLLRFTDLLSHGPEVSGTHRVLDAEVVPASSTGENLPGVGTDDAVIRLRRIKENDQGTPIALECALVPFSVAPRLLREDLDQLTTLDYFRRTAVPVTRSRLYLMPMVAGQAEAESLGVEPGTALFHLRRETYLRGGAMAELLACTLSPDTFQLFVEQSVDTDLDSPDNAHEEGS